MADMWPQVDLADHDTGPDGIMGICCGMPHKDGAVVSFDSDPSDRVPRLFHETIFFKLSGAAYNTYWVCTDGNGQVAQFDFDIRDWRREIDDAGGDGKLMVGRYMQRENALVLVWVPVRASRSSTEPADLRRFYVTPYAVALNVVYVGWDTDGETKSHFAWSWLARQPPMAYYMDAPAQSKDAGGRVFCEYLNMEGLMSFALTCFPQGSRLRAVFGAVEPKWALSHCWVERERATGRKYMVWSDAPFPDSRRRGITVLGQVMWRGTPPSGVKLKRSLDGDHPVTLMATLHDPRDEDHGISGKPPFMIIEWAPKMHYVWDVSLKHGPRHTRSDPFVRFYSTLAPGQDVISWNRVRVVKTAAMYSPCEVMNPDLFAAGVVKMFELFQEYRSDFGCPRRASVCSERINECRKDWPDEFKRILTGGVRRDVYELHRIEASGDNLYMSGVDTNEMQGDSNRKKRSSDKLNHKRF